MTTLGEALGGLVVGGTLALGAGVLMARWRWLERALLPVAIVAKVTPVVVVAPLFVLWFGFGAWPRLLIAALLGLLPNPHRRGSRTSGRAHCRARRVSHAGRSRHQRDSAAQAPVGPAPTVASLKVATTLALLGAVVAEWVGGDSGLGRAILLANSNLDTTTALAGVATIAALGILMIGGLTLLKHRYVFWLSPLDRP